MHPMYDTSGLTDDELLSKLNKARMHLGDQISYGHNSVIESIHQVIYTLEAEQERRYDNMMLDTKKKQERKAKDKKVESEHIEIGKIEGE